jgi:hypothetical protein
MTLAFASRTEAPLVSITQRMLKEASWAGSGAGTFSAALPIYQDINEEVTTSDAPTAAAALTIELGRPFFWAILAAAFFLVVALLAGALSRGRDWIYAATAAGGTVAAVILTFANAGLFSTPMIVILAATIGIGIGQSKSRSV